MSGVKRPEGDPGLAPPPATDLDRRLLRAFGKRLAHLRVERGLSQKVVARHLGTRHDLVSKYERGLHAPKFATLLRLRSLFSVTLDHLLAGASQSEITDPRLLKWVRAANQLSPDHRAFIANALESMVRAAQAADEREKAAAGGK